MAIMLVRVPLFKAMLCYSNGTITAAMVLLIS